MAMHPTALHTLGEVYTPFDIVLSWCSCSFQNNIALNMKTRCNKECVPYLSATHRCKVKTLT